MGNLRNLEDFKLLTLSSSTEPPLWAKVAFATMSDKTFAVPLEYFTIFRQKELSNLFIPSLSSPHYLWTYIKVRSQHISGGPFRSWGLTQLNKMSTLCKFIPTWSWKCVGMDSKSNKQNFLWLYLIDSGFPMLVWVVGSNSDCLINKSQPNGPSANSNGDPGNYMVKCRWINLKTEDIGILKWIYWV